MEGFHKNSFVINKKNLIIYNLFRYNYNKLALLKWILLFIISSVEKWQFYFYF